MKTNLLPVTAVTKLTWSSSNTKVAKVAQGVVTGIKAGTVTITVSTSNGKKDKVQVQVLP